MAEVPTEIKSLLLNYITLLNRNNIPVEKAYLFGSYSKGKNKDFSDIDLAIVSNVFEGVRIKDRSKIRKITLSVSSILEVLPFNPKDFTEENPLVKEIIETGIRIA
ncbi:MAG: nucleotidyltransferase [Ignavibacteria bacterium RIFOXYB2_FULL_35_12]|nr:MAG: nucleotidyltransferase [Ignavibacteria bacterium GWA2_36_19]OGU54163.1 MAG: nucleotidyltransferase [Ignavibacteria bacterium GWC2_35_8]OGU58447.1 MAG: nucleotidyltransferase [Ignavibacteria bacterium GWF2_35_20]OGU77942.1 MAG: nucleotidyltransferase [Ignavibacteria bacterium RBG_16_35_7]OGU78441.1 MAG: nucleotidyltransferase [Ignavibacteria bacterium RIFOXYA2_FULL_35_9]OGU88292.1 MAG: nucleotidyltransferase [Ignavibacteria bacterium RIFOXYC12_FULL_35_11]OGU91639.1 MAG: nucleotidyltran